MKKEKKIWITADTHFGHQMLIDKEYRPADFELKTAQPLWDLSKNDILIHLGDVCLGKDEENHIKFINNIWAKKILIKGNHDHKSNTWYLEHGWDFMAYEFVLKFHGKMILFSHEPKPVREGIDFNIHGHTHGNAHRDEEHCDFYDENYHIEISLEKSDYKPISLNNLI